MKRAEVELGAMTKRLPVVHIYPGGTTTLLRSLVGRSLTGVTRMIVGASEKPVCAAQLGCIADDFTGATDLASTLANGGMKVMLVIGVPSQGIAQEVDAIVVALKSRTMAATDAVARSIEALRWLQSMGASQIYFKYCSTFDSRPSGNIGPVIDGLMEALGADFSIACPAFPRTQRTVYNGHLFVGSVPLHESSMKNHPLTPMSDPNLVRVLQAQTRRAVGLLDYHVVAQGAKAIAADFDRLRRQNVEVAIVDAIFDRDLIEIGRACATLPLVTGASGVAIGLPQSLGIEQKSGTKYDMPAPTGHRAVISGSCSAATNAQVARFRQEGGRAFRIEASMLDHPFDAVNEALDWAGRYLGNSPLLVYSTAQPDEVRAIQNTHRMHQPNALFEGILSRIARGLVERGAGQLIVCGGETAGACIQALDIRYLVIGPEISPGVPWCYAPPSSGAPLGLHLALKSGNFGDEEFFSRAFEMTSCSI